jgi:hypothetical protein
MDTHTPGHGHVEQSHSNVNERVDVGHADQAKAHTLAAGLTCRGMVSRVVLRVTVQVQSGFQNYLDVFAANL